MNCSLMYFSLYLDISRKFHLESFRKRKLWFEGSAIFLLLEVCSTEFDILSIRAFSDHVIRHILYYVYAQDFQPGVGGGSTPYDGLYGEAPPERGIFFRSRVYERVRNSLLEVYQRIGKSVIWVCDRAQKG